MPRLNDLFPTNYLKAADFEDGDGVVTIDHLEQVTLGQGRDAEDKWVIYFREVDKGLVLNKTNAGSIAKLHGDDTDDWIGKRVTLFSTEVDYKGEMVEAIRVRSRAPKAGVKRPARPAAAEDVEDPEVHDRRAARRQPVLPASAEDDDEEIPF